MSISKVKNYPGKRPQTVFKGPFMKLFKDAGFTKLLLLNVSCQTYPPPKLQTPLFFQQQKSKLEDVAKPRTCACKNELHGATLVHGSTCNWHDRSLCLHSICTNVQHNRQQIWHATRSVLHEQLRPGGTTTSLLEMRKPCIALLFVTGISHGNLIRLVPRMPQTTVQMTQSHVTTSHIHTSQAKEKRTQRRMIGNITQSHLTTSDIRRAEHQTSCVRTLCVGRKKMLKSRTSHITHPQS